MQDLKNNFPVYSHEEADAFPDLTRLRIETRIATAPNPVEREVAESLLHLYDRGELEVSNDPITGELMVQLAYIN